MAAVYSGWTVLAVEIDVVGWRNCPMAQHAHDGVLVVQAIAVLQPLIMNLQCEPAAPWRIDHVVSDDGALARGLLMPDGLAKVVDGF